MSTSSSPAAAAAAAATATKARNIACQKEGKERSIRSETHTQQQHMDMYMCPPREHESETKGKSTLNTNK